MLCNTRNLLADLENAPIGQAMSYPIFRDNAATILQAKMVQQQQAEYRVCDFRQLYNCNKPPFKNIPPKCCFFCMMRFSVSKTLCDWRCNSRNKTERNKPICCQFRHNLLVILDIRMIEGAMATAGSAAFPTFLVSNFCKHKQACRWIRVKRIASFAGLLMKGVKVLDVWYLFLCWNGCWRQSKLKTKDHWNETQKRELLP